MKQKSMIEMSEEKSDWISEFGCDGGSDMVFILSDHLAFASAWTNVPRNQIERVSYETMSGRLCVELTNGVDLWVAGEKAQAIEFSQKIGVELGDRPSTGRCSV